MAFTPIEKLKTSEILKFQNFETRIFRKIMTQKLKNSTKKRLGIYDFKNSKIKTHEFQKKIFFKFF